MKAIEFGGGDNPKFHPNYDIRKLPNVDVVIDLNRPLPISGEEYDLAYSKYLLEHINWRNVRNFLKEIHRILKPGGMLDIITANLLEQAKVLVNYSDNNKEWNDNLVGMIFGAEDYRENIHQCGFSPEYLSKILEDIGFKDIITSPILSDFGQTDMFVQAVKSYNTVKTGARTDTKREIKTESIKNYSGDIDRRQWILNKCNIGEKILDVGCADGWIFNNTHFRPYVTSVDLDIYDIPNFQQMDAHNLEFPDKSFDTVILGEILEHVENPVQVLREANRVGKRVLMTIPDETNWSPENYPFETLEQGMKRRNLTLEQIVKVSNPNAKELYTKDNHKHLFHNRYYAEDTLKRDLEEAGIVDYEMTRLQYGIPQWSFFTVETRTKELVTDHTVIEEPIITKGPIITQGPIATCRETAKAVNRPNDRDKIGQLLDRLNDRKLRIAIISTPFFTVPPSGYSGLEMIVWDLAQSLDELGHEVTIFGPEGSKATKNGSVVFTGPSINTVGVNWLEEERKRYDVYKDIITPDRYDIVHDHSWFGFPYLLKGKYPQLKVIHTHHGSFVWESPPNW